MDGLIKNLYGKIGLYNPQLCLTTFENGNIIIFKQLNMMNTANIKPKAYDLQAEIFKVLTHPARLAILDILREGEHCVCHMEAWLGYRQAYLSQQLSVLRQAGLIRDRRDGWNIYYQIVDERIYKVLDQVREMTGTAMVELKSPSSVCACPKCSTAVNFGAEIPVILPIKNIQ